MLKRLSEKDEAWVRAWIEKLEETAKAYNITEKKKEQKQSGDEELIKKVAAEVIKVLKNAEK